MSQPRSSCSGAPTPDAAWLASQLGQAPSRLLYVGHATAADGDVGHADRAALHLADDQPVTASDLMSAKLPLPPRVALMACASGGDYQFDEATGLVAAMILVRRATGDRHAVVAAHRGRLPAVRPQFR